jgi:anaerobic ribonucleoside-triphosphate reductase activating protein
MLNLHAVLPRSRANGPGVRFAIWFQGCSLGCPGCFNPDTHPFEPRLLVAPGDMVERLAQDEAAVEGITISGGEPFEQPDGLLELLRGVRARTGLSVILFSGYTLPEITALPKGGDILSCVDVLIAGRYDQTQRIATGLRGSANKTVHLLTDRYSFRDIETTPAAEVLIGPDGSVTASGINPSAFRVGS